MSPFVNGRWSKLNGRTWLRRVALLRILLKSMSVIIISTIRGFPWVTTSQGKSEHKQDCEVESTAQSVVKYSVRVPDIAADTWVASLKAQTLDVINFIEWRWHALIYYIYTGTVYFAPLISEGRDLRRQAIDKHLVKMKCGPSLCSPKSMYRLADIVRTAIGPTYCPWHHTCR